MVGVGKTNKIGVLPSMTSFDSLCLIYKCPTRIPWKIRMRRVKSAWALDHIRWLFSIDKVIPSPLRTSVWRCQVDLAHFVDLTFIIYIFAELSRWSGRRYARVSAMAPVMGSVDLFSHSFHIWLAFIYASISGELLRFEDDKSNRGETVSENPRTRNRSVAKTWTDCVRLPERITSALERRFARRLLLN